MTGKVSRSMIDWRGSLLDRGAVDWDADVSEVQAMTEPTTRMDELWDEAYQVIRATSDGGRIRAARIAIEAEARQQEFENFDLDELLAAAEAKGRQQERDAAVADSIDAAWAAVEAALPPMPQHITGAGDKWHIGLLQRGAALWEAEAFCPDDSDWQMYLASGPTPAAALRALAAQLAER